MENSAVCPVCHTEVKSTDYFCSNCGKNLKPEPPSTSLTRQIVIYLESFFLPPYGIVIGIRYLRQGDSKSKTVGIISIVLTILSLLVLIKLTFDLIDIVNSQVNNQLQNMEF
ncbi:MAG: hypothetical protein A2V72_02680 [Candidatus Nealsonbacteria bacterium RBG_13_37_56]|uniref:Zinc-ribbon domain-containing protein n=1 Tax=Candidatus Nealsonbacteria bacterium RBG_13_37_56 TaxID=1801661 RepID=A0A1G2DXH7_9BACT|nr:MAG: hypothetical protein A2V72_02680 [Candidatus Nealsonbacteria bacterium RBG_13_37_56]